MFELRWYQEEAVSALLNYNYTKNPLVAMPTGTGKSVVIAEFIKRALELYPTTRILMLTHVKELVEQNAEKLRGVWKNVPLGIYSAGLNSRSVGMPVTFGSMQSVYKHIQRQLINNDEHFGKVDLLIVDEAHLISDKDTTTYRKIISELYNINPYVKVVGLTATPYRMKSGMLTDCGIFGEIIYDLTQPDMFVRLIKEGYLAPLIPKRTSVEIDVSDVSINKDFEYNSKQLARVSDNDEITFNAVREIVECGISQNRTSWIIFCTSIEHCEHVNAMLLSLGISSAVCHSELKGKQNDAVIEAFKQGKLTCLVNNNKLTTGFDNPKIDLIGMLRPTNSVGLWCLDEDTEVLTLNGWKNKETILIGDRVPSFDVNTQSSTVGNVLRKIDRPLMQDEYMVTGVNQNINFNVSNKHKMLISERKGRARAYSDYKLVDAETMFYVKDHVRVPTSLNLKWKGVGLSESELLFLGLFMTDGCLDKSNNQITIYQSSKYPDVQATLDRVFLDLGFPLRKITRTGDICFGKVRPHPITRWQVAYGNWKKLEQYVGKDFPETLQHLTESEFDVLLQGINMGDGAKNNFGQYERKTWQISTVNSSFADNLQRCAVLRGYNCKIVERKNSNIKIIHIVKGDSRIIKHNQLSTETYSGNVWCVSTTHNTIVTRRKGVVMVMGNCQMLGRGTRPYHSKENCLVLDFAGNTKRLGCINDPNIPSRRKKGGGGTGDAPVKVCPECSCYNHAKARYCEVCGTEFTFRQNLFGTASNLELIKDTSPQYELLPVDQVIYNEHRSIKGGIPTLQVTYICGLSKYYEYVCFEHQGYSRKRAEMWWSQRSSTDCPDRVYEALGRADSLKKPSMITVHINKKYPEVKSVSF